MIEIESQIISKYFQLVDEFGKFNREILSGVNEILVESARKREVESGEAKTQSVIEPDNELGIMEPLSLQLKYLEYLIENTDPKESLETLDKIEHYLHEKEA